MDTFILITLFILCILVSVQIIYSYISFNSFTCPDCPTCPEIEINDQIPSNEYLTLYLKKNYIDVINDNLDSINYIKTNVIFSDNYVVNYQLDSESYINKIKNEFENNKEKYISPNIRYVQYTDQGNISSFLSKYNLGAVPTPTVYYKGTNLVFAYIVSQWKILIDTAKF
tara:strand:+ start:293 stop:802 length:510 start_codon:yes stop_codon:yes gene_type:complete